MGNIIKIKNVEESATIMNYINHKVYPDGLSETQRRVIIRKAKVVIVIGNILFIIENNIEKEMGLRAHVIQRNHIIKNFHSNDHSGIKLTYSQVKSLYAGITEEDVSEIIKTSINSLRETPPGTTSVTRILPIFPVNN
ncbi:hypothetical protein DMUE_0809 [Dictyocoela muelleri]|nr:hypothetical protein DMUE_0809 [Dictyocoela muelleri]